MGKLMYVLNTTKNVSDASIKNDTASESGNSDHSFQEWKAARSTIDNYDKVLGDWRKTGFSIVAGLTTAEGLLRHLISNPVIFAAIISSTMVFVSILYWIDRYYYNLLSGALIRARFLEAYVLKDSIKLNIFTRGFFSGKIKYVFLILYIAMAGTILLLGVVTDYQESSDSVAKMNQLNINKTGIQNNLSDTQIQKEMGVQKNIDQIIQQQYSGLFLPILIIGAVPVTSAIMVFAWFSSYTRHKIMDHYACLKNIYDASVKKEKGDGRCREKLQGWNTETKKVWYRNEHVWYGDKKLKNMLNGNGSVEDFEDLFMKLLNKDSRRFVKDT